MCVSQGGKKLTWKRCFLAPIVKLTCRHESGSFPVFPANAHIFGCTPSRLSIILTDNSPAAQTWTRSAIWEEIGSGIMFKMTYQCDLDSQLRHNQNSGCRLGRWGPGEESVSGPLSSAGLEPWLHTSTPLKIWQIGTNIKHSVTVLNDLTPGSIKSVALTVSIHTFRCGILKQGPTLSPNASVSPAWAALSVRKIPWRKLFRHPIQQK